MARSLTPKLRLATLQKRSHPFAKIGRTGGMDESVALGVELSVERRVQGLIHEALE
jgi:hypothetical protein